MRDATAHLIAAGARIDWRAHFPQPGRVARLPAYPWQRERHWNGERHTWSGDIGTYDHPLLGVRTAHCEPTWTGPVQPPLVPWLADHRVAGAVILPASGYVEMAPAAGRRVLDAACEAENLELTRPVVVPWDDPGQVRLELTWSPHRPACSRQSVGGGADLAGRRRPRGHTRNSGPAADTDREGGTTLMTPTRKAARCR
ncbi:hypothetical protein [Streptomyces sp. Ac-502]|uniref:polyketide synthase dehydratase domain-containing protein n=1 Tax=Streptomyces sp. Ac-502 TaxID=3342801 RepID=UPI0038626EFD